MCQSICLSDLGDVNSNNLVAKPGMVEMSASLNYVVWEYAQDEVRTRQETKELKEGFPL